MRVANRRPLLAAAALAALAALGACVGDGDVLTPAVDPAAGSLFIRYVSLGNSITAGFQSGGILDSTEVRSNPNLLAQRAGITSFGLPRLAGAGCPQPFTVPLVPPPAFSILSRVQDQSLVRRFRTIPTSTWSASPDRRGLGQWSPRQPQIRSSAFRKSSAENQSIWSCPTLTCKNQSCGQCAV